MTALQRSPGPGRRKGSVPLPWDRLPRPEGLSFSLPQASQVKTTSPPCWRHGQVELKIDLRSFCSSTAGSEADAGSRTRGRKGRGRRLGGGGGLLTEEKARVPRGVFSLRHPWPKDGGCPQEVGGNWEGGGRPSHPKETRGGDRESGHFQAQPSTEAFTSLKGASQDSPYPHCPTQPSYSWRDRRPEKGSSWSQGSVAEPRLEPQTPDLSLPPSPPPGFFSRRAFSWFLH